MALCVWPHTMAGIASNLPKLDTTRLQTRRDVLKTNKKIILMFLLFCYITHSTCRASLLLFETYANVSSQIWPFLALRPESHSNHCVNSSMPSSRWLNKKIVTRWIKAPNFAHVFFRCLSNFLEGGARDTTPGLG